MRRLTVCALIVLSMLAVSPRGALAGEKHISVVASFSIIADMVREIGGERVEVTSLVGPGGDPHVFRPRPADAVTLSKADMVVMNGLGFEGWMARLIDSSGTKGEIIVATKGVRALDAPEGGHGHHHGHGSDHKAHGSKKSGHDTHGHKDHGHDKDHGHAEHAHEKEHGHKDHAHEKDHGHAEHAHEKEHGHKDHAHEKEHGHKDHGHEKEHGHAEHAHEKEHGHKDHGHEKKHDHAKHAHEKEHDHKDHGHKDHGHEKEHAHDKEHGHKEAAHEKHGHEAHDGQDPHAWNSLSEAKVYVSNILAGLTHVDPEGADHYRARAKKYLLEIDALDHEIRSVVIRVPEARRTVVTNHDAFRYLGRDYGFEFLSPVGLTTEAEPSARTVAKLIRQIREENISALFVENISDKRLLKQISDETGVAIGGTLYSGALSEPGGPAATFLEMMRHNIRTLTNALLAG